MSDLEKELEAAKNASILAGVEILKIYLSEDFKTEFKEENAPVTIADKLSNIQLCSALHREFPSFGILTEEVISANDINADSFEQAIKDWREREYCWLIDPLDGTKDFIKKTGEFGIHVGLTRDGMPVMGVNYYPTTSTFYFAIKGKGAYKQSSQGYKPLKVSEVADISQMKLIISRSNPDERLSRFIEANSMRNTLKLGSAGYKLCNLAEGSADLYLVFNSTTSLWDTCSSQIILHEAGGIITDCYGNPIDYRQQNKTKLQNGIIASNGKNHALLVGLVGRHIL